MVVRPVDVTVGSSIAVVRAVDVAAWDVVMLMFAAIGENAGSGQLPLAQEERFGWVGRIDGPDVSRVVGVGAVFGCNHGQVAPVDAENRVFRPSATLIIPRADGVKFCGAIAQEVVVRDGVVYPSVSVQSASAAAPFFWCHVGMAATVGAVPALRIARAAEPSTDFIVLGPGDAFGVWNGWGVRDINDAQTCIPIGDVEQGLARDGMDVEHIVVVEQRAAARGFRLGGIAAPADDFTARVLIIIVDIRSP